MYIRGHPGLVDLYLFGCFYLYFVEMMKIGMFCYSYQHSTLYLTN